MNIENKIKELRQELALKGTIVLDNPKKGTSIITKIDNNKIRYIRGTKNSSFILYIDFLIAVYNNLSGNITVNDIQFYRENEYTGKQAKCRCDYMMCIMILAYLYNLEIHKSKSYYIHL